MEKKKQKYKKKQKNIPPNSIYYSRRRSAPGDCRFALAGAGWALGECGPGGRAAPRAAGRAGRPPTVSRTEEINVNRAL